MRPLQIPSKTIATQEQSLLLAWLDLLAMILWTSELAVLEARAVLMDAWLSQMQITKGFRNVFWILMLLMYINNIAAKFRLLISL